MNLHFCESTAGSDCMTVCTVRLYVLYDCMYATMYVLLDTHNTGRDKVMVVGCIEYVS